MNRAYKYRVYPTAEQEQLLTDTFGSCRFVYNHYLALQSENCQQGKAYRNKTACNNDCSRILKQEQPWLKQICPDECHLCAGFGVPEIFQETGRLSQIQEQASQPYVLHYELYEWKYCRTGW